MNPAPTRIKDILAVILANQARMMNALSHMPCVPEDARENLDETRLRAMTLASALMKTEGGQFL